MLPQSRINIKIKLAFFPKGKGGPRYLRIPDALLSALSSSEAAFLSAVLDYIGTDEVTGGRCFASQETIANRLGLTRQGANVAAKRLKKRGLISWTQTGRANHYVLNEKLLFYLNQSEENNIPEATDIASDANPVSSEGEKNVASKAVPVSSDAKTESSESNHEAADAKAVALTNTSPTRNEKTKKEKPKPTSEIDRWAEGVYLDGKGSYTRLGFNPNHYPPFNKVTSRLIRQTLLDLSPNDPRMGAGSLIALIFFMVEEYLNANRQPWKVKFLPIPARFTKKDLIAEHLDQALQIYRAQFGNEFVETSEDFLRMSRSYLDNEIHQFQSSLRKGQQPFESMNKSPLNDGSDPVLNPSSRISGVQNQKV